MSDTTSNAADTTTTNGSGTAVLESLSEPDRQKWQLTGELPKAEPSEPAAADPDDDDELEPAAKAEPAAKPAATTAPAADKPISKRQQQINELIRSRTEAEQRAAKLEERLAQVEGRVARVPATEKAEPAEAKAAPIVDPSDPEPDIQKYEDFHKYQTDLIRWQIRQDKREAKAEADRAEATKRADDEKRAATKRIGDWVKRRDAYVSANPDKAESLLSFLGGVFPDTPIGDTIMDSPVGAAVAVYLQANPDVLERIQSAHPIVALRELGKLEAKLDTTTEVTRASASAGPAAKTVTTAPAPATTLTARSAEPPDPLDAALKDRDFRRYEAEANARDLAGTRH